MLNFIKNPFKRQVPLPNVSLNSNNDLQKPEIICPDESLVTYKNVYGISDINNPFSSPCKPEEFRSLLTQLNNSGTLCKKKAPNQKTFRTLQQQVSNCNPKCNINKNLELNYRDWETLNSEYDKCQNDRGKRKDKQNKKFEKEYPSEWMQKKQMNGEQERIAENNIDRENDDIRKDFDRVRDNGTDEEIFSYGDNLLKAQQYISDQSPEAKWNMDPDKKNENKILELGGKRKSFAKKTKKRKSRKSRSRKSRSRKSRSRKSKKTRS